MRKDATKIETLQQVERRIIRSPKGDGNYIHPLPTNQEATNQNTAHVREKPETLSITQLGKTWVAVDIDNRCFIKLSSPEHKISFDHMTYKGGHYEMQWDLFTEKPPLPGSPNNEDIVTLKIPQLVQIAQKEMSEKYAIPAHELLKRSDFDVMVNLKSLAERENGVLPDFEFFGRKAKVDLDNFCFRLSDNCIPINGFKPVSDPYGDRYAFIDTHTLELVKIDMLTIKEMPPENIVKVVIPSNDKLDPYYIGKNREPDLNTYLLANPMISEQKASVIPLSQTNLPAIIKSNERHQLRHQFEQTQRLNARKARHGIK